MKSHWFMLSCLCITGCMANSGLRYEATSETNINHLSKVRKGMCQSEVLSIMRNPYSYECFEVGNDVYDTWFYVTRATGLGQSRMVPQNLTPLTFKNGVLVGTGYNWYYYAMNEQAKQTAAETKAQEKQAKDLEENTEIEDALKAPPEKSPALSSQADPIAKAEPSKKPSGPPSFMKPWKPVLGAKKIEASKVQIGMTEAEVTNLLGNPLNSENYQINDDLYDVWFYEIGSSKKKLPLTFKNGVLVSKSKDYYDEIKQKAPKDEIDGYTREAEDMEEKESDQNFDYW